MTLIRMAALAVAAAVVTGGCSPASTSRPNANPSPEPQPQSSSADSQRGTHERYVIWAPGGMPSRAAEVIRMVDGVRRVTTVTGGLHWADRFETSGGSEQAPQGYSWPVEVAYVVPEELAAFVDPRRKTDYVHRRPHGDVGVPAATFARMRRAGDDYMTMWLTDRSKTVGLSRRLPDPTTLGFEVLMEAPAPAGWGERFLLVESTGSRVPLMQAARSVMEGRPFRLRAAGETPLLRYADAVTPQMYFKERFGEFPARTHPDGTMTIHSEWVSRNIVTRTVPLLGRVTCHKRFARVLALALTSVKDAGRAASVDPADFGGCYSPRFIGRDPSTRISSHAWGAAADLNASANPFGAPPQMDMRVVGLLKMYGFNWGGNWLNPDGMHFEWGRD